MSEIVRAENPFGSTAVVTAQPSVAAHTDQQRAIAEVQAAMMIARANPRNPVAAMDRILTNCQRQSLAEVAIYSYARGGSEISGPSIRLAEAIAQAWGNIQFGIREMDQSGGVSTVQAYAWDVETNVRREMLFEVPHTRHTRRGSYKLEDPRDIYETVANNGARRLRACILAIIPGDVIETAVKQCDATLRARADTSPEAVAKMVEAFAQFGVTKAQIETRIQRRLQAIQPAQIVSLKKIYASLRDGMSTPAEWFEAEEGEAQKIEAPKTGNAALKNAIKAKKTSPAGAADTPSTPPHDPETGEITAPPATQEPQDTQEQPKPKASGGWTAKADAYIEALEAAQSIEELMEVQKEHAETISRMQSQNNGAYHKAINAGRRRMDELREAEARDAPAVEGQEEML